MVEQREVEDVGHEAHLHRMPAAAARAARGCAVRRAAAARSRPGRPGPAPGRRASCPMRTRAPAKPSTVCAAELGLVVVEAATTKAAPGRSAQPQRDVLPQAPGADDHDVAQVVAAPTQRRAGRGAARRGTRGASAKPKTIQYADQTREKSSPDFDRNRNAEPHARRAAAMRSTSRPHLLEQRHAALRRVKAQSGKNSARQRTRRPEQRQPHSARA